MSSRNPTSEDWRSRPREFNQNWRHGPRKRVLVPGNPQTKLTPVQCKAAVRKSIERQREKAARYQAANKALLKFARDLGVSVKTARALNAVIENPAAFAAARSAPVKVDRTTRGGNDVG